MKLMFLVMLGSILIASLWNTMPVIKDTVHAALDPTLGVFLDWKISWGMFLLIAIISLIMTLVQKYGTDQEALREIKKEQKFVQQEMKKYKHDPAKLMEFNKKQMEKMPEIMKITMRPLIFTFVPFVLLFRWFHDYFSTAALEGFRFLGFLSWFWFYLIFSIIFSSIFRKALKVA